jgi:hypothetical protein
MDISVVQDAVRQLEARGISLAEITSPMVREITGYGSYSSITEHLRTIKGQAPTGDEVADDGSPAHEETALAVVDDTPVDIIVAAERALQDAKAKVLALEAQLPGLEAAVEHAYTQVEQAAAVHLRRSYAVSKGALPSDDLGTREAEKALWEAVRAHRQVRQHLEQAPQAIAAAKGAVRLAQQQRYLAQQHPELLQELADAEARKPVDDHGPDTYRAWSIWRQEVSSARAAIDAAIRELGI